MKKNILTLTVALAFFGGSSGRAVAQGHDEKAEKHEEHETPGKVTGESLEAIKVNLEQGLVASQRIGKPISSKFEFDDGKLQLSVYTAKAGKFAEVIVDTKTGKVLKSEAITGGDDLAAARAQGEAMAKAKRPLRSAVRKALAANKGWAAISATPALKDGHPVAEVSIGMEDDVKTVSIKLD